MGIVKHGYGNRPEKRQQQLLSLEVTEKTRPLDYFARNHLGRGGAQDQVIL
jgi:hypothetical protein